MEVDARTRFSATVENYRRYRPDYPEALFDWWQEHASIGPGARVVDVGCGTGIATRQLAERGIDVIGVDPNPDMLAAAVAESPAWVRYVEGDAESLPVEGPLDAIVGGQCFHWIELDRALPTMRARLADGARVLAFWNLRDPEDALMADYEAALRSFCPEYEEVGAEPRAEAVASDLRLVDVVRATFAHGQSFDREGFGGRVWSSSYVQRALEAQRSAFDAALDQLFARHARDGRVRFVYRTIAVSFR